MHSIVDYKYIWPQIRGILPLRLILISRDMFFFHVKLGMNFYLIFIEKLWILNLIIETIY